ncbi:hypothetical protein DFH08DRAFT_966182 [Mycena albidolilacea]|uniref:RING-type domain-containing protein n=1 Tax=Mycena albidolilacea TaxID=1033008 RepID=A0AAD6ZQ58_9AGAR|nr:hypothetical protein DFH08DRAFT_966182 [Mycena albidolilacea]
MSQTTPGSENNPHLVDMPPRSRKCKALDQAVGRSVIPPGTSGSARNPFVVADSPSRGPTVYRMIVPDSPPRQTEGFQPLLPSAMVLVPDSPHAEAVEAMINGDPPATAADITSARMTARQLEALRAEAGPSTSRRRPSLALEASLASKRRNGRHQPLGTRNRYRSLTRVGSRVVRDPPLRREDLYLNGTQPAETTALKKYHECSICHFVKNHPASYRCGHSHCYACIRLWFEQKWTCPDCVTPVALAPFRHYAEEAGIEHEYPGHSDSSSVDYSWDGLTFAMEI